MDYSKAIRISRALADISQRELANKVEVDASLISMFESGLRKPSLDTLEKIADAIGIPFHLFTLLGTERKDVTSAYRQEMKQLALGLARLLLQGKELDEDSGRKQKKRDRKAKHPERQQTVIHAQRRTRKAG